MSFARLNYDDCTYKHILRESVGPGDYMIGMPRVDCKNCYFPSPNIRIDHSGAGKCKELIDVDSELMGITRRATNCPLNKFLPSPSDFCEAKLGEDCMEMTAEDTRLSNPPCTLRGTGWNRWEWLCINPQEKVLIPFDYMINNRLLSKDNHRPCVQDPIDQNDALPPKGNNQFTPRYTPQEKNEEAFDDIPGPTWTNCTKIPYM
uniref:Uncharacterized protein n=1 Tax=viral metagenome TaxID=1070528 RepID=A0A6C0BGP4_9ZZZZ